MAENKKVAIIGTEERAQGIALDVAHVNVQHPGQQIDTYTTTRSYSNFIYDLKYNEIRPDVFYFCDARDARSCEDEVRSLFGNVPIIHAEARAETVYNENSHRDDVCGALLRADQSWPWMRPFDYFSAELGALPQETPAASEMPAERAAAFPGQCQKYALFITDDQVPDGFTSAAEKNGYAIRRIGRSEVESLRTEHPDIVILDENGLNPMGRQMIDPVLLKMGVPCYAGNMYHLQDLLLTDVRKVKRCYRGTAEEVARKIFQELGSESVGATA